MRVTEEEKVFLTSFGYDLINASMRLALDEFMRSRMKGYGNAFTFNVAMNLSRDQEWQRLAKDCDSWQELKAKLESAGITETQSGLKLNDRRISWKALTLIIRDKYA